MYILFTSVLVLGFPFFIILLSSRLKEEHAALADLAFIVFLISLFNFYCLPSFVTGDSGDIELATLVVLYVSVWFFPLSRSLYGFLIKNTNPGSLPFFFYFVYFFYNLFCYALSTKPVFLLFLFLFVSSLAWLIWKPESLDRATEKLLSTPFVLALFYWGIYFETLVIRGHQALIEDLGPIWGSLISKLVFIPSYGFNAMLLLYFLGFGVSDALIIFFALSTFYGRLKAEMLVLGSVEFNTMERVEVSPSGDILNRNDILCCVRENRSRSYSTLARPKTGLEEPKYFFFYLSKRHMKHVLPRITRQLTKTLGETANGLERTASRAWERTEGVRTAVGNKINQNPYVPAYVGTGVGVAGFLGWGVNESKNASIQKTKQIEEETKQAEIHLRTAEVNLKTAETNLKIAQVNGETQIAVIEIKTKSEEKTQDKKLEWENQDRTRKNAIDEKRADTERIIAENDCKTFMTRTFGESDYWS